MKVPFSVKRDLDPLYHSLKGTTSPVGVLGISSDGDDRRIFLGLKFSIPGFFWYENLASIFWGSLI